MMPAQISDAAEVMADTPVVSAEKRSERVRVLHVVSCLGMGGTEHGVLKVINGLGSDEFEHRICAVRGVDADFARRMNAPKTYSAGSSKSGFQFPLFRLAKIMKEFQPHVVHSRNFGSLESVPAAKLAGIPAVIHSEHGYELEILAGLPLRRRILCRAFYGMADAVFTVTKDLSAYHAKQSWLPAGQFRVIYNGVVLEKFAPHSGVGHELRSKYEIPEGCLVIGSVGRLVPIKDHGTLLGAAESMLRRGKNVHVLLVGDGPESARLKGIVSGSSNLSGRVTFAGASDCVPELLNAMDIFVLPSICEGMSNTLLEAMATGLPVVATRTGGSPEVIEDGRSGELFTPGNVEELATLLDRLADGPARRRELGETARQRAVSRFSLSRMMQDYRDLYLELAGRGGVRKAN